MTDTYALIERALDYISENWAEQPELSDLAAHVGMSEYHLQRLFTQWAGISPKKFLGLLTLDQARRRLAENESVLDASLDSGLSGPGRLHDLFVTYEAMTPGEYKRQAAGLELRYGWHDGPFGETLLMVSDRGVCGLAFEDGRGHEICFDDMASRWPQASFVPCQESTGAVMRRIFASSEKGEERNGKPLRLLLKGTEFQVKVWEALMQLPEAGLTTYRDIARNVGIEKGGAQAVGSAVGMNPIAWLIPCHRVIRSNGDLGGYRWGNSRKLAMMGWEASSGPSMQ